ncbi:MAG: glycoside hydrolase family 3 C-terminal domain-containing protein [Brevundimonas sp.]
MPRSTLRRSAAALAAALLTALAGLTGLGAPAQAADKPWMDTSLSPAQRADSLLSAMTLTEKLAMLHGGTSCGYAGCIDANTRLGIPALHLQDGPVGVGDGASGVTQLAAPVAGAATWDTGLMRSYGEVLGAEQWGKGTNVVLAPTVNIVRDPRWGRAFESLGEDPFLAGAMGTADIQGIQSQGPMAQVKHFVAYNQETNRQATSGNAVVSDRALREIYTPAFDAAVKGGVDSAMCSYNLVNGTQACENAALQNGLLKKDLGFGGFITADWGATHSTVASANNGLDMEMPDARYFGSALTTAVNNGQVSVATIDDKVRRILTSMFRRGLFDHAQTGTMAATVTTAAHRTVARQVATQGSVLLKNAAAVLPFTAATHSVAVIGGGAGTGALTQGGGSAAVNPSAVVTPLDGLRTRAGAGTTITYAPGAARSDGALPPIDTTYLTPATGAGHGLTAEYFAGTAQAGTPVATRVEPQVDSTWGAPPAAGLAATGWSARFTGKVTPPTTGTYTFSLTSDDGSRLFVNGQKVVDMWRDQGSTTKTATVSLTAGQPVSIQVDYYQAGGGANLTLGWQLPGQSLRDQAVSAARAADVAVVFTGRTTSEGSDLADIDLPADQNQLIADVAAANPNTVVVVNSGSAVAMPWASSVRGIVEAWYPGQEYGSALAALLFGDENFSGKLPVTFPRSLADVPARTAAQFPGQNGTEQYSEGIDVGYRWYDRQAIAPLFPFGHGLSYTTFAYSGLQVGAPDGAGNVVVSFDVTNTGSRAGSEVAQVYVGQPASSGEAPKNLRGFAKVPLQPGEKKQVSVTLDARSFQYWDGSWTKAAGTQAILVGSSSRDVRLTGAVPGTPVDPGTGTLDRTGWVVTATSSGGGDVPARMVDGQTSTRWSSGAPMVNGQAVTVDLGATRTFTGVTMDSAGSANDYARGYQVFVSADGATWGQPVATGAGTSAKVVATFPSTSARWVKIVQTGSASSWWSIAELNLTTGTATTPTVLPRQGWVASASSSGGGDVPARLIDADPATRWSSGSPMVNGQTVTLDLGAARTFSRLTMDSGGSANDYARGYQVLVSSDGASWGAPIATGAGTAALVSVTLPTTTARWVRVVQTGTSSSWWSISDLNLYG